MRYLFFSFHLDVSPRLPTCSPLPLSFPPYQLPGDAAAGAKLFGGASASAPAAEEEDEDDIDLFGSDDEEEVRTRWPFHRAASLLTIFPLS